MLIKSVLVIEDSPTNRTVIRLALARDFEVYLAENGYDGLVLARGKVPDLILLDVRMPGMDGRQTLKQLASDPITAAIPVIFISASVQAAQLDEYLRLPIIGVIRKPFDPLTLPAEVLKLTDPL